MATYQDVAAASAIRVAARAVGGAVGRTPFRSSSLAIASLFLRAEIIHTIAGALTASAPIPGARTGASL